MVKKADLDKEEKERSHWESAHRKNDYISGCPSFPLKSCFHDADITWILSQSSITESFSTIIVSIPHVFE
jgi:hypothetical protein